jgi:hypothetical protein
VGRELSPVDAQQWLYERGFQFEKEWECDADGMDVLREDGVIEKTLRTPSTA